MKNGGQQKCLDKPLLPWYEEGSEVPPFKLGPPVIQSSNVPPFSSSILHMVLWNSPDSEIYEGQIWVWSTLQTESKMQVTRKISSNK